MSLFQIAGRIGAKFQHEFADGWFGTTTWRGPRAQDANNSRRKIADNALTLVAALLPWSTAATSIAVVVFLAIALPSLRIRPAIHTLTRPLSVPIVALWLLALAGLFWADDIAWPDSLRGLPPLGKLMVIPLLVYHFAKSDRAENILIAFVLSCTTLMLYSSVALFFPELAISFKPDQQGVPVKNYIDQSQGFVFCAFAVAAVAVEAIRKRKTALAAFCFVLAAAFFASLIFVNVSRTALVTCPIIAIIFVWRYFSGRLFGITTILTTIIVLGAWAVSPNLQRKISSIFFEYSTAATEKGPTSVAQRIGYWEKSIKFIEASPIIGHGTGSNKILFAREENVSGSMTKSVIANPHNQTLLVAIQWGVLGVIALYAMWITHLLAFRASGIAAWIGLLAVVQNILSSIFNSHLFDFYQGWLYVLAVGVAAGVVFRNNTASGTIAAVSRQRDARTPV